MIGQHMYMLGVMIIYFIIFYRLYSNDASMNNGFRAAAFTIELRDKGYYKFMLPPDQVT